MRWSCRRCLPGTTVVGIPARPVERKQVRGGRPTFDAYGSPVEGVLDPLLRDIESLRAELSELEIRVAGSIADRRAHEPDPARSGDCQVEG